MIKRWFLDVFKPNNEFGMLWFVWLVLLISHAVTVIIVVNGFNDDLTNLFKNVIYVSELEDLNSFSKKKLYLISFVSFFSILHIFTHWFVFKYALPKDLKLLNSVLKTSSNTNMILNLQSFNTPITKELAKNYNNYVSNRLQDYENHINLLIKAKSLHEKAISIHDRNYKILNSLPQPIYIVYNDKPCSIEYYNESFKKLCGVNIPKAESDGLSNDTKNSITINTINVFSNNKTEVIEELRNYNDVYYRCVTTRTPIVDRQGIAIMAVVILIEMQEVEV